MTEAEAKKIVERYEALLLAVAGSGSFRRYACPLEVFDGRVIASQTDHAISDDNWFPDLKSRVATDIILP